MKVKVLDIDNINLVHPSAGFSCSELKDQPVKEKQDLVQPSNVPESYSRALEQGCLLLNIF